MKLNKKTKEAVIKSRNKWIKIWKGTGYDDGPDNCTLCSLFNSETFLCKGCPITDKGSIDSGCHHTPYSDWSFHFFNNHKSEGKGKQYRVKYCKECLRISKDEAIFIDKLLPKADRIF